MRTEERGLAVRRSVWLTLLILVGLVGVMAIVKLNLASSDEAVYMVNVSEPMDKKEAKKNPPIERWPVLKQLDNTTSIELICYPSYHTIEDPDIVQQVADKMQDSKYVEAADFPNYEPDVKVYFKKKDGFVLVGRLHTREGVLNSPEGPVIKLDRSVVTKLIENTECDS